MSTLDVSKANPVPGTTMGIAMSALSNTKTTASAAVPERPADLPATYGDAPMNFVATEWGNWGTVLRIAVTSESPDPNCGNGNQCVIVKINSDSADDSLKLAGIQERGPGEPVRGSSDAGRARPMRRHLATMPCSSTTAVACPRFAWTKKTR